MNILYISSEVVPFVKSGGLADVVGSLPSAVQNNSENTAVMLPGYTLIDEQYRSNMTHVCDFYIGLGWRTQYCGIDTLELNGIRYYFVDNKYYFGRNYIYGNMSMDECERFSFFNKAAAEALLRIDFIPDIVHCNDWQCGMFPYLLKTQYREALKNIRTVYTIHNIHYQGIFPVEWVKDFLSVSDEHTECMEFFGNANFMKCGIIHADAVTTVSPTYASEITTSELGEGLEGVLRQKYPPVCGILNGIDLNAYSPLDDIWLESHFAPYRLEGKAVCKESLQYELWLDREPDTPLLGIVSRLTEQKGLYLIEHTWERIMQLGVQIAVIGTGDRHFEEFFKWLSGRCGGKVAARTEYNERLSRRTYAGCDIFLMPSRTEPCGLAQLIAMRYGALPVVHETGGLRDTVIPFNCYTGEGTGFTFYEYSEEQFVSAVERAVCAYRDKTLWRTLVCRVMQENFSWDTSAKRYIELYRSLM